jgi:hypothetical protein
MGGRWRLADLLAGLSMVVDLGYGLPLETAMRACLVRTSLARRMGLTEREPADVFYVSLLLHVGCVANRTRQQLGLATMRPCTGPW